MIQIHLAGFFKCVKLGPNKESLTTVTDTTPQIVNSGCPGSKSITRTGP